MEIKSKVLEELGDFPDTQESDTKTKRVAVYINKHNYDPFDGEALDEEEIAYRLKQMNEEKYCGQILDNWEELEDDTFVYETLDFLHPHDARGRYPRYEKVHVNVIIGKYAKMKEQKAAENARSS